LAEHNIVQELFRYVNTAKEFLDRLHAELVGKNSFVLSAGNEKRCADALN
jgi:hypothetical protein